MSINVPGNNVNNALVCLVLFSPHLGDLNLGPLLVFKICFFLLVEAPLQSALPRIDISLNESHLSGKRSKMLDERRIHVQSDCRYLSIVHIHTSTIPHYLKTPFIPC